MRIVSKSVNQRSFLIILTFVILISVVAFSSLSEANANTNGQVNNPCEEVQTTGMYATIEYKCILHDDDGFQKDSVKVSKATFENGQWVAGSPPEAPPNDEVRIEPATYDCSIKDLTVVLSMGHRTHDHHVTWINCEKDHNQDRPIRQEWILQQTIGAPTPMHLRYTVVPEFGVLLGIAIAALMMFVIFISRSLKLRLY